MHNLAMVTPMKGVCYRLLGQQKTINKTPHNREKHLRNLWYLSKPFCSEFPMTNGSQVNNQVQRFWRTNAHQDQTCILGHNSLIA